MTCADATALKLTAEPIRTLKLVPKPPIVREELDAQLWDYLHRDPEERAKARRELQEWMTKILAEISRFDEKHTLNFQRLDTRLAGVEARTSALESVTTIAGDAARKKLLEAEMAAHELLKVAVDAATNLRGKASLPPPPAGLGKVSDSGIHKFTEDEMEEWQRAYQAQRNAEDAIQFKKDQEDKREDKRKLRNAVILAAVLAFLGTLSVMMIREIAISKGLTSGSSAHDQGTNAAPR
jgi:hypothetical protein